MKAYLSKLHAAAARAAQKQSSARATRTRLSPLEDRLAKLLSTIPAEVQKEGLSLTALQISLRGRWRGSCHPGELGAVLRRLGYQRSRKWQGTEGFRALWYPST